MTEKLDGTVTRFLEALADGQSATSSVSAATLAGSFAAALGSKAAAKTYASALWESVDPTIQSKFRESHEELELLWPELLRGAKTEPDAENPVRALTIPFHMSEQCLSILEHLQDIVTCAERASLADVGAASALALAALESALLHVRERLAVIPDKKQRTEWFEQAERMWERGVEIKEETSTALFVRMSAEG